MLNTTLFLATSHRTRLFSCCNSLPCVSTFSFPGWTLEYVTVPRITSYAFYFSLDLILMFYRYALRSDLRFVSFQSIQILKIFRQIPLCETNQFRNLLEYANCSHLSHHNKQRISKLPHVPKIFHSFAVRYISENVHTHVTQYLTYLVGL
jgi:hypothetical protein